MSRAGISRAGRYHEMKVRWYRNMLEDETRSTCQFFMSQGIRLDFPPTLVRARAILRYVERDDNLLCAFQLSLRFAMGFHIPMKKRSPDHASLKVCNAIVRPDRLDVTKGRVSSTSGSNG
nr:hypothetical protein CFP56_07398 [Quercus suber]